MSDAQISFSDLVKIISGLRNKRQEERVQNSIDNEDRIAEPGRKYLFDTLTGGIDALDLITNKVRIQLLELKEETDNRTFDEIIKELEGLTSLSDKQISITSIFNIIDEMLSILKKDRASKPFIMNIDGERIELEENDEYIPVDYVRDYIFNTRTGGIDALTELKKKLKQGNYDLTDINF